MLNYNIRVSTPTVFREHPLPVTSQVIMFRFPSARKQGPVIVNFEINHRDYEVHVHFHDNEAFEHALQLLLHDPQKGVETFMDFFYQLDTENRDAFMTQASRTLH